MPTSEVIKRWRAKNPGWWKKYREEHIEEYRAYQREYHKKYRERKKKETQA